MKVRQPEPDPVVPQLLVDADVPCKAVLGLQRRVREARKEELVEGRRAETGAGAAAQSRAPLADQIRDRAALRPVRAVDAVVLDTEPARHEQPVPEAKRLLKEGRLG